MPAEIEEIHLPAPAPGTQRTLKVRRYGREGARPKAYLHAALHADEWPGLLALHHLARLLDEADRKRQIQGEVVLVPVANPIGLDQGVGGRVLGRFALMDGGANFNRGWPDLARAAFEEVSDSLGPSDIANVALVRAAMLDVVDRLPAATEVQALQQALLSRSVDADIVLDVHCDSEALVHVFGLVQHRDKLEALGADLGAAAILLEQEAGGDPFDVANSGPWLAIRGMVADDVPIPPACFAATVELRGRADVSDDLAEQDAEALYTFLAREGVVSGGGPPAGLPRHEPTPLEGVNTVKAPVAGVLAYRAEPGDWVEKGDVVAEIVDPLADDPAEARTVVTAATSGVMFSRRTDRLTRPGATIAKIAGAEPLAHRKQGALLEY